MRLALIPALAIACAADSAVDPAPRELPPPVTSPCAVSAAVEVTDPASPAAGLADAPDALLAGVEGSWWGDAEGHRFFTEVARGAGPIAAVAGTEDCPARYEIPMVQRLVVDEVEVALASGTWAASGPGAWAFVTTTPLLDVVGLAPEALVPAWWDTVDLALATSATDPGDVSLSVSWVARREISADATALAPGAASSTGTVAEETEPVWTAVLLREDDYR
jgi:hypothetical protein